MESIMHTTPTETKNLTDLQIAEYLWNILDNIDTAFDLWKPEMRGFEKFVQNEVSKRHLLLETDGYKLKRRAE